MFLLDAQQFGAPAVGLALAIAAPLIATTLLGAFNGTLVTKVGLQPIIATLVLYLGGRGIAQLLVNGELRELRNLGSPLISSFEFIGLGQVFGVRFQIIIMTVVVIVAIWVLRATTFGRYVLATGGNPAAARLAGVPVNQVKLTVYCISGFLAGWLGWSSWPSTAPPIHTRSASIWSSTLLRRSQLEARRYRRAGQILGTFFGAMIIQLLRFTLIAHNIPDGITRMVIAGAIVVAVLTRRQRST